MDNKRKTYLLSGVTLIVISPFLGLLVAPSLHPLTCQPVVSGLIDIFSCLSADAVVWGIIFVLLLLVGVPMVLYSFRHKAGSFKTRGKLLFTIPWTRKIRPKVYVRDLVHIGRVIFITAILVILGLLTNVLPFTYGLVKCANLPVQSTKLANSYKLPGDEGYGLQLFYSQYIYCSPSEARMAGFHRDIFTTAGKAENQADLERQNAIIKEEARFSPSKANYEVYIPSSDTYVIKNIRMSKINSHYQTFYTVSKEGRTIGEVRELYKKDDYNICSSKDSSKRYCSVIGTDAQGRQVSREYTKGAGSWKSYYIGVNIGDTGVILSTTDDQAALELFGKMTPYTTKP